MDSPAFGTVTVYCQSNERPASSTTRACDKLILGRLPQTCFCVRGMGIVSLHEIPIPVAPFGLTSAWPERISAVVTCLSLHHTVAGVIDAWEVVPAGPHAPPSDRIHFHCCQICQQGYSLRGPMNWSWETGGIALEGHCKCAY